MTLGEERLIVKANLRQAYEILSPRLVLLVTTVNSHGGINAAPISWSSPISFDPPIVMISLAPVRHTYQNIKQNKEFVINVLNKSHLDHMLRCAAGYPPGINKLEIAGLGWYSSEIVKTPRVREGKAWLECKLLDERIMGDHIAIFGDVVMAEVKDEMLTGGRIDFTKVNPPLHISKDEFAVDFKIIKRKRYD